MTWFKRRKRNRRLERAHVLDVKLRSEQVRAARWRGLTRVLGTVVGIGGLFALVVWGGVWLLNHFIYENSAFAIAKINIRTDGSLAAEQIQKWSGVKLGDNLLALDLARVKRDLELVPWIREAAVARVLPHGLELQISERVAMAQVRSWQPNATGRGYETVIYYIDPDGFVMRPRSEPGKGPAGGADLLPALSGVRAEELSPGRAMESTRVQSALDLIDAFERSPMNGYAELGNIDVTQIEVLRVTTRQGSELVFGETDLDLQLRRWRLVHDYAVSTGKFIATLDLSITNNLPARWAEMGPAPGPAPKPIKPPPYRKKHV